MLGNLDSLTGLVGNKYVSTSASLFLILYAGMARPQLPQFVANLFDNAVFRLTILSLIVFMSGQNIQLSVMVAIAFTITMNLLNEQKIAEGFVDSMRESMIDEVYRPAGR
jgi:hypothetical protein